MLGLIMMGIVIVTIIYLTVTKPQKSIITSPPHFYDGIPEVIHGEGAE